MNVREFCLVIATVSLLFACQRADANFATFVLDWNGTNAVCCMNGEACPPARVDRICAELARLDKDMQIRVVAKPQAPASDLVALLSRIQKSGLHLIVLLSPARQGAVDGYYWVPVDSSKWPISACIPGTVQKSGFIPAPAGDPFHEIGAVAPSTNATIGTGSAPTNEMSSIEWQHEMHRLLGRARAAPSPAASPDLIVAERLLRQRMFQIGGGNLDGILGGLFWTEILALKGDLPRASASWNQALPWWEPIATEFDQRETDICKSPFAYMRFLRDRYPSLREHESPKAARILMPSPK